MRYTQFTIKNFRGIKTLTLDFYVMTKYKIFTLVGLNESGKTTILEAIDFFQKDVRETERHTLIPKDKKTNFNDDISVSATVELDNDDEEAIKEFSKTVGFIIEQPIKKISIEKKYTFKNSKYQDVKKNCTISLIGKLKSGKKTKVLDGEDEKRQSIVKFIENELLPPIIYWPNFLVNFPSKISLQEQEKEPREQEFYRNVVQDILDSLDDDLTINEHLVGRMESDTEEDRESLDAVLNKMSEKITDIVLNSWEKIFGKFTTNRQIVIKPWSETDDNNTKQYYLEIKQKIGTEEYQIQELSLGFRWFFAFLLFTEFRKYRSKDKGEILFLLDEPASNLHSTAQIKLRERFNEIISKSKLVYTTHSHHLINSSWLEGAFIIRNKALDYKTIDYDSSKTVIEAIPYRQFVAQYPDQETYFKPILDSLDYKPSDLELVPNIVIVEGKNDFYTFKYVNEIILGNTPQSINFYPGNGAGKNDKVIKLYIAWGRNFVVFMDSDEAGKEAKKKYVNEIGKIIENKVITLSDINNGWQNISTEELFTNNEKKKIEQAIDPNTQSKSKAKFNQAIQNLLFLKQIVQLNKSTITKFKKIFENLKNNLST